MRWKVATLCLALLALAGGGAHAESPEPPRPQHVAAASRASRALSVTPSPLDAGGSASTSTGWAWRGGLERGRELHPSSFVRRVERFEAFGGNYFGSEELVSMLETAAAHVAGLGAPAKLSTGELSKYDGGRIMGHRSHQSGRDVDVAFYMRDREGAPVYAPRFVRIDGHGEARVGSQLVSFDDERNFRFIESLLSDSRAEVQHVFVSNGLRARLMDYARREGASRELLVKMNRVLMQPSGRNPHRDHFHVRIYCPSDDQESCRDRGPFWPWAPEAAPQGVELARVAGFSGAIVP